VIEILKAFLKTTSGTLISLLIQSISVKIFATLLGRDGIGLLALLRQILNTTATFASLSGQTALVQGGAARQADEKYQYLRSVLVVFLITGTLASLGLFLFAPRISSLMLGKNDSESIALVRWLMIPVCAGVFSGYALGVMNVYRALGQMAAIQIIAAGVALAVTYPMALLVIRGQTIALVIALSASTIATLTSSLLWLSRKGILQHLIPLPLNSISINAIRAFLSFASVTMVTTFVGSGVQLAIRALIVRSGSLTTAGEFEAAWTVGMTYTGLITSAFAAYYLPTLSATKNQHDREVLISRMFRLTTLMVVPLVIVTVLFKSLIIQLLFSSEFLPSLVLLRWMLIGTFLKLTSWVLAYPMLATADMRTFLITELGWNASLMLGSYMSIVHYATIEGIGFTFMLAYVGYFIYAYLYSHKKIGVNFSRREWWPWLSGLAIILAFSLASWDDVKINPGLMLLALIATFVFMMLSTKAGERHAVAQVVRLQLLKLRRVH
jgi:PST family polysaccharide transporter